MRTHVSWIVCLALAVTSCRLQPDPPSQVVAVAGIRSATVRWLAPPQASPLAPITYTVIASPGGASASTEALEASVKGLENGGKYTFTVIARNRFGESQPSAPSAPVTTPDLPGAPGGVLAVAGDGQAAVRWTAPSADGGSRVTSYTVTAVPGHRTAVATGTTVTMAGLANGGTYTFTVAATTAVGTGPASAPSSAVVPQPAVAFDTTDVPVGSSASALDPTWRWGPFMQIFVRAYRDSDGDGEGDLAGLVEKLDYLRDLGVRGILLLPVFANQDRDHGYLTTNFRDVAPDYGTLADLDRLLDEAHRRGMGVVLDGVLQYSGSAHPGFVDASASAASPWRSWYVWAGSDPGWGYAWWEAPTGWYYGFYGRDNPVLDWKNPAVLAYQENTLRFWLNRGVDGFRLDSVQNLVQNGPDAVWDQPESFQAAAALRRVVDGYQNRLLLCEAPFNAATYAGSDVCGGGFLFSLVKEDPNDPSNRWSQAAVLAASRRVEPWRVMDALAQGPMQAPIGSMGTLLANHDRFAGKRLWDQLGGDEQAYRLAAATLLLMPGTPFLYYGEEVGMAETVLPSANPDSDHHQRGVMSWTADPATAGFSERAALNGPLALADPDDKYLAPVPNAADHNVAAEQGDPGSLLSWYRQLIALRSGHDALARGLYQPIVIDGGAWAFERSNADEDILVFINYESAEKTLWYWGGQPGSRYEVLVASGTSPTDVTLGEDGSFPVTLPPQSMVAYRLARQAPPLGDLYVRGSFSGWSTSDTTHLAWMGGSRYQKDVFLPAGLTVFDIVDPSTSRVDLGLVGGGEVRVGEPRALEQTAWRGWGAEVTVDVPTSGMYQFTLSADDPYRPVLTIVPGPAPAVWQRPPQPAAPSTSGLSWVPDPANEATWFFADGELLALFNNHGHTFIEFWVDGVNVIGGYDPAGGGTNWGPAVKGHSPGYPFGQFDANSAGYWPWEGFVAGFNYIDPRYGWVGGTGAPHTLEVQPTADGRLDVHVFNEVQRDGTPFYDIDVHYYLSRRGIGVRDEVTLLAEIKPWGWGDSGGQFLMTQADSDIDPTLPYDTAQQPDWYRQLVVDGNAVDLDPFPPYGKYTPSVEYTDQDRYELPEYRMYALPGNGLVPPGGDLAYVTVMGRQSRPINLSLRVDKTRSHLPQLEYYCEINGERDYLNFNFNASLGWNGLPSVPKGITWLLYGDFLPWTGADPEALRSIPMLSDGIP